MLGLLRHASNEQNSDSRKAPAQANVKELIPTPEEEIANPVHSHTPSTPDRPSLLRHSSSTSASPFVRKTRSRQSFLGRTVSYVGSALGLSSHAYIQEQHTAIRRKCHHELGAEASSRILDTSYHGLLTWIRDERLTRLPHKGSTWDKVLLQAHHFADQIETLHQLVEELNTGNGAASQLIYGPCMLLLELGHENASALAQVFDAFYQFGLELRPLLKRADLFPASASIQDNLSRAYIDLINVVTGVAIQFHQVAHGLHGHGEHSFAKIDLFATFGSFINVYHSRIKQCSFDMWSHALRQTGMGDYCDVAELQKWLAPHDSVLLFLASANVNMAVRPAELTCTWFQSQLNTFLKSEQSTLLIEGKAGSGKTVLAHWAIDRLQRPFGRKSVSTLNFTFNQNIAAQSTVLAMLKTLLYQLLELRVGDLGVYEAILEAYNEARLLHDADSQETKLWQALSTALKIVDKQSDETLVLVIDGIDEVAGRAHVAEPTAKKLHDIADKYASVRLLQFCQPVEKAKHAMRITLDAAHIGEDLRAVAASELQHVHHFHDRSAGEEEAIVDKLAVAAGNSMLWMHLACSYLSYQTTHQQFDEALKSLLAGSKSVTEITVKLLEVLQLSEHSKQILSLLIAAERPLLMSELQTLLQINLGRQTVDTHHVNMNEALRSLKPFLTQREGLFAIIHADLENAFLMVPSSSKVSLHLTERHQDMVMRLMIYAKSCLREEREPCFDAVEFSLVDNSFKAHRFLEYVVRYWAVHFKRSTLFKATGKLQLPAEFVAVFAGSTQFAILEQACWSAQYFLSDALELYTLAYRLRHEAIGGEKACTLQSAITCAIFFKSASRVAEAIEYYGRCSKFSHTIFGAQADFTVRCCEMLLTISETLVVSKRTELMTWRETCLLILVEACKHRHGASSKEVLEIYEKLVALYVFIKEEHKVIEYREIIRKITIIVRGEHSGGSDEIDRHLDVVIRKHKHEGEIDLFEGSLFGEIEVIAHEELTLTLVEIIILRASKYCEHHEWAKAEELYVELWLRLTQHCHHHHVLEWHYKKIEVMLIYCRFLESRKRHTEACSIILALWREYEHHEFASAESVILLLHEVAVVMKSLSLLTYSLSVFRKCWSWFRSCHREEHEVYKKIEHHMTVISTEIVETSKTTTHHEHSETIIREVFESSITSTTEVTSTTIELCKSLTSIYIKQERHFEAIQCIKAILKKSWSAFFESTLERITLCSSFSHEHIELVLKMAHCHILEKRFEKAEFCYIRLYRAVRGSCKINDVLVVKYSELLLEFYKKHAYYHKAISSYQELLVAYRTFYGASHKLVIQILYELGDLCRLHNRTHGYWIEYYLEIVNVLNKGLEVCHESALQALIIVANYYFEDCRYSESLTYFRLILTTFCKHGKKYKFFESITEVQLIFEHYFRSLEESRTEISIQISIIKEYREACVLLFGASASITIHATLLLAESYCRHESYQFEAISLYEHIHKHTESVEIKTKVTKTLTTLYVKKVTTETTTVTKEMIERSTTMTYERYIETKKTHSCYHEKTLSHFRELILLYHKCSRKELIIKELRSLIIEIVSSITTATTLIETAKFVSELYRSCGYIEFGHELIRELKMQIIYKWIGNEKTCGFNVSKLGRGSFAFVAALEWHLVADYHLSLTHYISALMAESLYYERFCNALNGKSVIEVIICSARLHKMLHHTKRFEVFAEMERRTVEFFMKHETSLAKFSKVYVRSFVMVLIEQYHVSTSQSSPDAFVAFAGHAALHQIRKLITQNKHKEALELTSCSYAYLMANKGLDDPTEISLGFQMCLLMAGRGVAASHKVHDAETRQKMMDLSKKILGEVFDICENFKINLARLQMEELNDLISLIGEQKDYKRLHKLLSMLWNTRETQKTWNLETRLKLGKLLVEAEFAVGHYEAAIKLCSDLMYNCRRVHGARHANTLMFASLLRKLYTAQAVEYQKANAGGKAKIYYQKAMALNEEILKLLVDPDDCQDSDDDDDLDTELAASTRGAETENESPIDHATALEHIRCHLHHLKLAFQRHGGWHKHSHEYEALTSKIWTEFGADLKMSDSQVHAGKWNASGFGSGKAESEEDVFQIPTHWAILA